MSTELTERKKKLRDEFIDESRLLESLLGRLARRSTRTSSRRTRNFSSVPWRQRACSIRRSRSSCTSPSTRRRRTSSCPGIRQHIKQAIGYGATAAEIMEVLELTSTLGIHACNIGVPILVEELAAAGTADLAGARRPA